MERFANQYVLVRDGAERSSPFEWNSVPIGGYHLFNAPDTPIHIHESEQGKTIMIGFAFHIIDPDKHEEQMLQEFPTDEGALLEYIDLLCGNFVLILERQGELTIMHDPAAVFKVFYYQQNGQITGVASDPALLREVFVRIQHDNDPSAREFYSSNFYKKLKIRPGDRTPYKDVLQLLPNHWLKVNSASVERYFPREKLSPQPVQQSIEKVEYYLDNVIRAAERKYSLKCSLTAGWDSRVVLAATKHYKDSIEYYTFRTRHHKPNEPDMTLPPKMAKSLGFSHEIIPIRDEVSPDDRKVVLSSYDNFFEKKLPNVVNGFSRFDKSKDLLLFGSLSEICKNYYDEVPINDGKSLCQAAHFPVLPYTVDYFQQKFERLDSLCNQYGYDIKDMSHWEQDITNFGAQSMYFYSFMVPVFSPFNNRSILQQILSTPRNLRDKQRHRYYRKYLNHMWPELNRFPINPTMKRKLMVLGKKLGVYYVYKTISTRLRT